MQLKGRQKQFVDSARLSAEKFCNLFETVAKIEREGGDNSMEQKISYILIHKKIAAPNPGSNNKPKL